MSAPAWVDSPLGRAACALLALWLVLRVLDLSVELWRARRAARETARVVVELQALCDLANGWGPDLLREVESLREVVEQLRDDDHAGRVLDRVLDEVRGVRSAVERPSVPGGGAR